jgi:Tfp pilus assembly protein PilX
MNRGKIMKDNTRMGNEEGSVIVLSMVMLVLLTILGISATRTSTIEVQIASNEIHAVQNFYQAEAGEHVALETSDTWMTDPFLTTDETTAYSAQNNVDIDSDSTPDVNIEIRYIQDTDPDIANTNNLPCQKHISPPPVGSGYSLNDYEIRKYGITATSINGSTQVQIGVYKVFNKY